MPLHSRNRQTDKQTERNRDRAKKKKCANSQTNTDIGKWQPRDGKKGIRRSPHLYIFTRNHPHVSDYSSSIISTPVSKTEEVIGRGLGVQQANSDPHSVIFSTIDPTDEMEISHEYSNIPKQFLQQCSRAGIPGPLALQVYFHGAISLLFAFCHHILGSLSCLSWMHLRLLWLQIWVG